MKKYQGYIVFSFILIALGTSLSVALKESFGSLGTVLIALGGFFLIIGMNRKRKSEEENSN